MTVQLDTNIVTRLSQPGHPQHPLALNAIKLLQARGDVLTIVPQNLFEFWVVATRPVGENGLGLSVLEAVEELNRIKAAFVLKPDDARLPAEWERLVSSCECRGKVAHDARIIAAMQLHGIESILTFNVKDFTRYPGVRVIDPGAMA